MSLVSSQLLTVADSNLFNSVLQCPVLIEKSDNRIDFFGSSRDASNKAFIFFCSLNFGDFNSQRIKVINSFLTHLDFADNCVGVLPGYLYRDNNFQVWLLGNAFFEIPHFHSRLFKMRLSESEHLIPSVSTIDFFSFEEGLDFRFRTTPSVYQSGNKKFLIYSASDPYSHSLDLVPRSTGFPKSYGIFGCAIDDELNVIDSESILFWPKSELNEAIVSPRQDPINPEIIWFSYRSQLNPDYCLKRIRLTEIPRNSDELTSVQQLSTKNPNNSVAYPFIFALGRHLFRLNSVGRFGDKCIELQPIET